LSNLARSQLGPDLVFVVLHMGLEENMERIRKRHDGDERVLEMMTKFYEICEPAREDEDNVIDVRVTLDMSREDVLKKVLEMLE